MFYITRLHGGHFYICPTTSVIFGSVPVPAAFDHAYDTRKLAQDSLKPARECAAAIACCKLARALATGGR